MKRNKPDAGTGITQSNLDTVSKNKWKPQVRIKWWYPVTGSEEIRNFFYQKIENLVEKEESSTVQPNYSQ